MIDTNLLLVAFTSGILGASFGGLSAFILFGFVLLSGVVLTLAGGPASLTNSVALGVLFGPHVFFTGAVAAAAYAGSKKLIKSRKDIETPLIKLNNYKVLLVGGVFGVFGYLIHEGLIFLKVTTDTIALAVVLVAIIVRYMYGRTGFFGTLDDKTARKSKLTNLYGRLITEKGKKSWIPWQNSLPTLIVLGLALGVFSGWLSLVTGSKLIGFAISVVSLIFLETQRYDAVTHHMSLPAGIAAIMTGSIWIAGLFGLLGALFGELFARLYYNWGDTHLDPPSGAIALTVTIILLVL